MKNGDGSYRGVDGKFELVYWVAASRHDRPCYSIRTRTRAECAAVRKKDGVKDYDPPRKVAVKYKDAFELILRALGEGGIEY